MFMPLRGRRDDCKTNGNPDSPDERRAFRDDNLRIRKKEKKKKRKRKRKRRK
jgi:hypothetical protein